MKLSHCLLSFSAFALALSGAAAASAHTHSSGVRSLLEWGMFLDDAGRPEIARVGYDAAIDRAPTWPLPFLARAESAIERRENVEQVRADLETLAPKFPNIPRLHRLLGELSVLAGDDASAVDAFGRSLALRPEQPQLRARRAAALGRLSRFDEAAAEYALAVAKLPGDDALRGRYADALESAKRYDEARKQLDLIIAHQPGKEAPLRRLARFLERRGDRRGAARVNKKADALVSPDRGLRPLPPSRT